MLPELNLDPYTLLGWAALIGVGWNRLSGLKDAVTENNSLIREQNSRIDKLERWRAAREGFQQGYGEAKQKYGEPNRKLQG